MNISGKSESSGKPRTTADIAAAARRGDTAASDANADELPVVAGERTESRDTVRPTRERGDDAQQRARAGEKADTRETSQTSRDRAESWGRGESVQQRTTAETPERVDSQQRAQTRERVEQPVVVDRSAEATGRNEMSRSQEPAGEALEPLFTPELAESYRGRWTAIQSSFVDDPRRAVHKGDELVAEIMTNLADSFSQERRRLESQLDGTGEGTTENLRVALRRYRSFFERLLSL